MWTRLMVTWLFVVGAVDVMSFLASSRVAVPLSPNTVGHGLAWVHPAPVVTLVTTSEIRSELGEPCVLAPRMPARLSITRNTGEFPLRTVELQDVAARS